MTKVLRSALAIWRRLRLILFRGAYMQTKKPSIPLPTVSSETGAPELGTPDLTEFRTFTRRFPKDAGERDCYQFLLEQMEASHDHPPRTKAEFEKACRRRFRVNVESFEYCWREAIKITGACWDRPGRRPSKEFSR